MVSKRSKYSIVYLKIANKLSLPVKQQVVSDTPLNGTALKDLSLAQYG
jgi:hypothetical protein